MRSFLMNAQQNTTAFTLEELAQATGYKLSSIRTYYGKRLKQVLVTEQDDGTYLAHDLAGFDDQSFVDYMTQRSAPPEAFDQNAVEEIEEDEPPLNVNEKLFETLLTRAQDSAMSALQIFHAPHHSNRLVLFGELILNAWSMLLRAEMARRQGLEPLYPAAHPLKSNRLPQLLEIIYPQAQDPVRKNLEWLVLFVRDNAELLFESIHPYLGRLFQATVLNFQKRFEAAAGRYLCPQGSGQLIVLSDQSPPDFDLLREQFGDFVSSRLHHLLKELRFEESQLQNTAFCVEPGWTLSLYHNTLRQTIALLSGDGPLDALKKLDADQGTPPHPFSTVEAIQQINALLPYEQRISANAIEVVDAVYRVRQGIPNRYAANESGELTYSRAYIHWVARCIRRDDAWLDRAKQALTRRTW